jgi:iron complex transport system substrate-binding protein
MRRHFIVPATLLLSLLLLLTVACGAGPAASGPADERIPATPEEASAQPAERARATAQAAGTRVVEHAMGSTDVPANPQRVVVLDTGELDSALALGVMPVGAVSAFPDGRLPGYLDGMTGGITVVGTIAEPNLEAILALEPDLILSSKLRHEEIYDELSAIAPTVFAETVGVVWKDNLRLNAQALGKEAEAEALFEAYEARLAELREALGQDLPAVSVVRFLPGEVRIYRKASFIGTVLQDAGLPRPEVQDVEDFALYLSDMEGIPQMDGDVIFVTTYGEESEMAKADYLASPLWQQLEAVQEGAVYEVPDSYWMLGIGMLAANQVIDDLFDYLADESTVAGEGVSLVETRAVTNPAGSKLQAGWQQAHAC